MPLDLGTRLLPLRRILCPFCFEKFRAFEMHFRCTSPICKADFGRMIEDPILSRAFHVPQSNSHGAAIRSPWWIDPRLDLRRGFRRKLDALLLPASLTCPNCRRPTDCHLCPRCHAVLPDSAITLNAGHIAIFGPQSVGKTTFVTVLIHEMDHRIGPEHGFILEPLTDEVRDRYEREFHEMTYGGGFLGVGESAGLESYRRGHSATPSVETNPGVLRPLVYRLTRRKGGRSGTSSTLISFFDTAGEDWEMNIELLRTEARYLSRAGGLLFLIDPLRVREIAHDPRLSLTEKERHVTAADYLNDARKLATFFRRFPVKTPLAIVLNKLDRWGRLMEPGTALRELADGFAPETVDGGFDVLVHEELRSALRRWGMSGFLEHVETNFPVHRFFATSALGDASPDREDAAQPLPTPLLVDRPLLWLLEKQRILR